jgi:hypothetical protein
LSSRLLSKNVKIRIYKIIILPVVLYGCETWPLRVREKHKLEVFEDRVLRRIFGTKEGWSYGRVGKPGRKRPLGRPRRRWIDNIKMDLLEIGLNVVDWIGRYRWRALVNAIMNLRVP